MIRFLQSHRTIARLLHRGPLRGWIGRRVWAEVLSAPGIAAALDAGKAELAAVRLVAFVPEGPTASEALGRHVAASWAEFHGESGAIQREAARIDAERRPGRLARLARQKKRQIIDAYIRGDIDAATRDARMAKVDQSLG